MWLLNFTTWQQFLESSARLYKNKEGQARPTPQNLSLILSPVVTRINHSGKTVLLPFLSVGVEDGGALPSLHRLVRRHFAFCSQSREILLELERGSCAEGRKPLDAPSPLSSHSQTLFHLFSTREVFMRLWEQLNSGYSHPLKVWVSDLLKVCLWLSLLSLTTMSWVHSHPLTSHPHIRQCTYFSSNPPPYILWKQTSSIVRSTSLYFNVLHASQKWHQKGLDGSGRGSSSAGWNLLKNLLSKELRVVSWCFNSCKQVLNKCLPQMCYHLQ